MLIIFSEIDSFFIYFFTFSLYLFILFSSDPDPGIL